MSATFWYFFYGIQFIVFCWIIFSQKDRKPMYLILLSITLLFTLSNYYLMHKQAAHEQQIEEQSE
jgi:hypothetical protein